MIDDTMNDDAEPIAVGVTRASKIIRCPESTIYKAIKSGALPAKKARIGMYRQEEGGVLRQSVWQIKMTDLLAWDKVRPRPKVSETRRQLQDRYKYE